jgi:peptidoglycan-associated lipoprotein
MNRTIKTLLVSLAAVTLVACGSNIKLDDSQSGAAPVETRSAGDQPGAGNGAAQAGGDSARSVEPVTVGERDPLDDPASPLARRSVYFDFDSFAIRDEYRSTIDAHSRYLTANSSRRVLIQGNTDDRGSREYNLALGQKRAEAVRRALGALGVPESQMEAVSLGEERPRATSADEASWAENRRADLVYQ